MWVEMASGGLMIIFDDDNLNAGDCLDEDTLQWSVMLPLVCTWNP